MLLNYAIGARGLATFRSLLIFDAATDNAAFEN